MRNISYILCLAFFICSFSVDGQKNSIDIYAKFQSKKSNYKKVVTIEKNAASLKLPDNSSIDVVRDSLPLWAKSTIIYGDKIISEEIWKKDTLVSHYYFATLSWNQACNKHTFIKIFSPANRNRVITREYWCDSLIGLSTAHYTKDSMTIRNQNGDLIQYTLFFSNDSSKIASLYYHSGPDRFKDSIVETRHKLYKYYYINDTLKSKCISFSRKQHTDSSQVYDAANRLIEREHSLYNRHGDVSYHETISYEDTTVSVSRKRYRYKYNLRGLWREERIIHIADTEFQSDSHQTYIRKFYY